ncbi:hypothetical protein E2C01_025284 [Portunus trituberculatus]|uniref:Uncharacterized protein n=1 Tax=Portunus trituberculatus TaxID=210409 RepID=A0A5B7EG28_PORTR|nr:hypothetical protein [Portunus trituberculatus]
MNTAIHRKFISRSTTVTADEGRCSAQFTHTFHIFITLLAGGGTREFALNSWLQECPQECLHHGDLNFLVEQQTYYDLVAVLGLFNHVIFQIH